MSKENKRMSNLPEKFLADLQKIQEQVHRRFHPQWDRNSYEYKRHISPTFGIYSPGEAITVTNVEIRR
jgi:hypothetical protein